MTSVFNLAKALQLIEGGFNERALPQETLIRRCQINQLHVLSPFSNEVHKRNGTGQHEFDAALIAGWIGKFLKEKSAYVSQVKGLEMAEIRSW